MAILYRFSVTLLMVCVGVCLNLLSLYTYMYFVGTVMILSFRTPKKCVVITLKFELCGFTIEL